MSDATLVTRVAAFGLPGHDDAIASAPLPDGEWTLLTRTVRSQRLAGFLQAAIETGALPVTEEQRVEAKDLHARACTSALLLERRLIRLIDILRRHDIDAVVLKGSAVAHLVYPTPEVRSFGDNDVLLRSERFDEGVEILLRHGYERRAAPPRPDFDRRFAKGVTLYGEDGDELDLHRNLVFGTFGFKIALDELFRSVETFALGDHELAGLGPETRLLHACYHASLGDPVPRYSSVRDLAQMLLTGDHQPLRVLALARRWESEAVLARGVHLCEELLGVVADDPISRAVRDYRPTRREQRAIASYVGENHGLAAKAAASLPYLDGVEAKVAFLRALALPQEGFAESFGGRSGLAWIARGARSLLAGRGR